MAPQKKTGKKAKAQDGLHLSANDPNVPSDNLADSDITHYPEAQQNEYTATQAIYPDEFTRIHGRKDAWKVDISRPT